MFLLKYVRNKGTMFSDSHKSFNADAEPYIKQLDPANHKMTFL